MTINGQATTPFAQLFQYRSYFALHQALCAIAKFGVADVVERGVHNTSDLARELSLNENALYRTLRALSGQAIFQEVSPRSFHNTPLSNLLRSDVPGSLRALFIFSGSEFVARPFQEFDYSLQTGLQTSVVATAFFFLTFSERIKAFVASLLMFRMSSVVLANAASSRASSPPALAS